MHAIGTISFSNLGAGMLYHVFVSMYVRTQQLIAVAMV